VILTFWIAVVEESAWRVSALGGLSSDATPPGLYRPAREEIARGWLPTGA
jgi:hypothetical protein